MKKTKKKIQLKKETVSDLLKLYQIAGGQKLNTHTRGDFLCCDR